MYWRNQCGRRNRQMAIGKKLIIQGCCACVVSAVLIICISAPAVFSLVSSGQPVCLPGLSIRCHENDCGRFYQRCGSNILLEIPAHNVCYKGALVSASRTDLHSCPSTTIARNSSRSLDQNSGQLGSCNCNSCNYPSNCDCLCQFGTSCARNLDPPSRTWGVRQVKCKLPIVRTYPSAGVASCCLSGIYSTQNCPPAPMWEVALQTLQQQFTNLFTGQWFLQDAAASFTFPTPLRDTCCKGSGSCYHVCGSVRQYTVSQVREATSDFTTKVGEGAFATVYKAVFGDGVIAAVKRFNKRRPVESFEQEVEVLSSLSHRFLVNLIGYCEDCDEGGDDHASVPLTWEERVRVLISVGHGIDYLHYGTDPPMIHKDIKSANILLSSSGITLVAKLADFGLGRQTVVDADVMTATFGNEPPKSFITRVAGTPGYLDPEYLSTSTLSPKTDIYSHGVVLLELLTGRKPLVEERLTLSNWAKPYLVDENIWHILDPKLEKGTFDEEQLRSVAELALCCTESPTESDFRKRPTIREVLAVLTDLFTTETRMVNSSQRMSSDAEFSGSDSQAYSQCRTFKIENSMNYAHSEILPRD